MKQQKPSMNWFTIFRFGLVQTSLGSIVALTTATMNRVMVVELGLPALLPGFLIAIHYALQISRPRMGHGSDIGGRRTPWIMGGMMILALGAILAAAAIIIMDNRLSLGMVLAVVAFIMIGMGVSAAGTSNLALIAKQAKEDRRAAAATTVWLMMILGIVVTSLIIGSLLENFSLYLLFKLTVAVSVIAVVITGLAIIKLEDQYILSSQKLNAPEAHPVKADCVSFKIALLDTWSDSRAKQFTIFVFVSMLAYSAQDLILEPFAGLVFKMTPGETTKLSGFQHQGVFFGMVLVGVLGTVKQVRRYLSLRHWTVLGCAGSAVMLALLALGGFIGQGWPLILNVMGLGFFNGMFAVAAIGSMMALAGESGDQREGMRMGLWGASQAIAFGLGGFAGTLGVDLIRYQFGGSVLSAYGSIFIIEGIIFIGAAFLAFRLSDIRSAVKPAGRLARSEIFRSKKLPKNMPIKAENSGALPSVSSIQPMPAGR